MLPSSKVVDSRTPAANCRRIDWLWEVGDVWSDASESGKFTSLLARLMSPSKQTRDVLIIVVKTVTFPVMRRKRLVTSALVAWGPQRYRSSAITSRRADGLGGLGRFG